MSGRVAARAGASVLAPLFLVSFATVGFEIALTRYFAVAKWSEYGYWVISIVLAGFALSGVVVAIARDFFARHGQMMLDWLPPFLVLTAAGGFFLVASNPFNPLQLQNPATFAAQVFNIGLYYAALLPFFFLVGLFISLCFVLNDRELGRVYGWDLTGAGLGALAVLGLMYWVHPFNLAAVLLAPLAAAALWGAGTRPALAALAALVAGQVLLAFSPAAFNDYKAIYAPMNTPNARVILEQRSPHGLYHLLENFTERVDTDISSNAGMMRLPGPPASFGLYRDGNRISAIPRPGPIDAAYAPALLSALPYVLIPEARVLLAGGAGGFRVAEARELGAGRIEALEPEPMLFQALSMGIGPTPPYWGLDLHNSSPIEQARRYRYDIIDLSGDFAETSEANAAAFTAEAITIYLGGLTPGGIVSLPVSIREFPAYALRLLATVRAGLLAAGVAAPEQHVLVYRSAWNVRILVSNVAFGPERLAKARAFAAERSFDISYFPGMDPEAERAGIFNDLPAVSFSAGAVISGEGPHDAIADEAAAVLRGLPTPSGESFRITAVTFDRPGLYAMLRLDQVGTIMDRLELLPQGEIAPLVNVAVLLQAVVIALIVLAVPLACGVRPARGGLGRSIVYYAGLGLGFLFVEIYLIERASFYLNDRTAGFALVLTGMLIFSGLGSMLAARFADAPERAVRIAVLVVVVWGVLVLLLVQPAMMASLSLPWWLRAVIVLVAVAPASIALGLPFPLGLSQAGSTGFLPWAWGLNGAFSVVSTPLANLVAIESGFDRVLLCALVLYVAVAVAFPRRAPSRE